MQIQNLQVEDDRLDKNLSFDAEERGTCMKHRRLNSLVFIGIMGVVTWGSVFAVYVIKAFASDQNIYWTAQTMPLPLEETRGWFELLIDGDSLENHLSRGVLTIQNPEGSRAILLEDISVRLNNLHRV